MEQIRWGILGTANIATQRTIPAMTDAANATPLGLASRDVAKARAAADELGVPRAYGDYQSLLDDPDIDAVYVPLPNNAHVEWSSRALEAGKHVLCEKPLALASKDIEALIRARDRSGKQIEEAFSFRNHPQWTKIDELIASGRIGRVLAYYGLLSKRFLNPADIRNNRHLGGGALYDLGAYAIDACNRVFGRGPNKVTAAIQMDEDYGVDGLTSALLDYGDCHAAFTVSTRGGTDGWGTHQQFSLLGSEGWLRSDFPFAQARPTACTVSVGGLDSVGAFPSERFEFEPVNQYVAQIERFSRVLLGQAAPVYPIEQSLLTLRTIEALFGAAKAGEWRGVEPVSSALD